MGPSVYGPAQLFMFSTACHSVLGGVPPTSRWVVCAVLCFLVSPSLSGCHCMCLLVAGFSLATVLVALLVLANLSLSVSRICGHAPAHLGPCQSKAWHLGAQYLLHGWVVLAVAACRRGGCVWWCMSRAPFLVPGHLLCSDPGTPVEGGSSTGCLLRGPPCHMCFFVSWP